MHYPPDIRPIGRPRTPREGVVRLQVYVDAATVAGLQQIAAAAGVSVSAVARPALAALAKGEEEPTP